MKGKLIGIVGKKGVGKDTMADILISSQHNCTKLSFAEPLKKIVVELFLLEWDDVLDHHKKDSLLPQWNKTPRQLLQWIGTDIFRTHVQDDIWILHLQSRIAKLRQSHPSLHILVTDVRFQNEADCIRKLGGVIIRIVPSSSSPIKNPHLHTNNDTHSSETEQDSIHVDHVLVNDKNKGKDLFKISVLSLFDSLLSSR